MENKRLFGKICYIHRQMCRDSNQLFNDCEVTPVQMQTLVFINIKSKHGEKVCQKDIERRVNLRASSVSTLLTNLERDCYIVRSVSGDDARTKYIELTEKGKGICLKDKQFMDRCDGAIQSSLSETEQNEFEKLLDKIIGNISE